MTTILCILGLIALFGAFKAMSTNERKVAATATSNVVKGVGVYGYRMSKEIIKTSYKTGEATTLQVRENHQDLVLATHDWNQDLEKRGGVVKLAARSANDHAKMLGLTDINKSLDSMITELKSKDSKYEEKITVEDK